MSRRISVRGARANNLRNIDVDIPAAKITVFTGVSGSGKSSLVFDTIAAESQRQLNDTFPVFVRNRMPQMGKPDVDSIANLSVAIVVDQRPLGGNTRSTVGTAADLAPLLRLIFSRVGEPFAGYSNAFSFNQPAGMCPNCQGLGTVDDVDEDALLDRSRSLNAGALTFPTFAPGTAYWKRYVNSGLFDNDRPVGKWPRRQIEDLLHAEPRVLRNPPPEWYASSKFEGVVPRFRRLYLSGGAEKARRRYGAEFARVVSSRPCPVCHGARLNPETLSCRIHGRNIADASALPIEELLSFIAAITDPRVAPVRDALRAGLENLVRIGLGYLSLDRVSSTLSGGESQRVKLVRHLGSSLTALIYILDEPSSGLHPADVSRLAELILGLRDKGNTILLVEHDPDLIRIADHVIDLGPGAGSHGGAIVFEGAVGDLARSDTPTARFLHASQKLKARPRPRTGVLAQIDGADRHNLRGVSVQLPEGVLTVLTGVAGSGKSSLLAEIIDRTDGIRLVDQRPMRGTRRSNTLSYLGVLDQLRQDFARSNGVGPEWFSSNSTGRCPVCRGLGVIVTELAFMDDVELPCDACGGRRFNDQALGYTLEGRNISEFLALSVEDAGAVVDPVHQPRIADAVDRVRRTGLGYLRLGQGLDTLSGGERQRLKLARHLADAVTAYAFDEPTTGLHGSDVAALLSLFDELIDQGASLLVIEHDLQVMTQADWIIDIGPGAGTHGGEVTFAGTPEQLLERDDNATATHLRRYLHDGPLALQAG